MNATATEPKAEATTLFVANLSAIGAPSVASFEKSKIDNFSRIHEFEVRGPIHSAHNDFNSLLISAVALSGLELAQAASEDFGVELQFHLDLSTHDVLVVIDSGADELLAVLQERAGDRGVSYARHITDETLSWGYIADIRISMNHIFSESE